MSFTLNTKTYAEDVQLSINAKRYTGPAQDNDTLDIVDAKRTDPKPSGDFNGQSKGSLKLTRTMTDGTVNIGNGLIQLSVSVPADAVSSETDALIDDAAAWLATASAKSLLVDRKITQ